MKTYYEFWPLYRGDDRVVIVESPIIDNSLTKSEKIKEIVCLIDSLGYYPGDYEKPLQHSSIESATARDRGCWFEMKDGSFKYLEKPADSNTVYYSYNDYKKEKYLKNDLGYQLDKGYFVSYERTIKYLESHEIPFQKVQQPVCPPGFDGCVCRECGGAKYMAEPDGLINDGMLTCYRCKEVMVRENRWPYTDKEIKERESV